MGQPADVAYTYVEFGNFGVSIAGLLLQAPVCSGVAEVFNQGPRGRSRAAGLAMSQPVMSHTQSVKREMK